MARMTERGRVGKSRAVLSRRLSPMSPTLNDPPVAMPKPKHHDRFWLSNAMAGVSKELEPKRETGMNRETHVKRKTHIKRETHIKRSRSPSPMRLTLIPKREAEPVTGLEPQPRPSPLPSPLPRAPAQKKRRRLDENQHQLLSERARSRARAPDGRYLPGHATKDCVICAMKKTVADFPTARISAACLHAPNTCLGCIRKSINVDSRARQWDHINCPECGEQLDYFKVKKYADQKTCSR